MLDKKEETSVLSQVVKGKRNELKIDLAKRFQMEALLEAKVQGKMDQRG